MIRRDTGRKAVDSRAGTAESGRRGTLCDRNAQWGSQDRVLLVGVGRIDRQSREEIAAQVQLSRVAAGTGADARLKLGADAEHADLVEVLDRVVQPRVLRIAGASRDRKSTSLNSSHR